MVFSKKYLLLGVLIVVFSTWKVYAQEPNFSLYHYTPFFTNPGSIGVIEDTHVMLNYRNQSLEAGTNFKTTSLSGFHPFYLGNHRLVVAGNFLNDQVSDFVKTNGGLLGVAYSIRLTASSELSFGVQGGFFQRKTGGNFITDDQFVDGVFNPTVVSGDAVLNQTKGYSTLSTGLYYQLKDAQGREKAFLGSSIFNATEPNISFLDAKENNLPLSLKATAGYRVYQGYKLSVLPTTRWVSQANNNFFNIGSRFGYELSNSEKANKKIELGLWYNSNDLGVFSIAYEQSDLIIGVSYDLPVGSDLSTTQSGIFELAISLRLKKKNPSHMPQQAPVKPMERVNKENAVPEEITTNEEVEESEAIIEKEEVITPELTIEEGKLDVEALNAQFSHRDYLIRFEHASGRNVTSENQKKVITEVTSVLMENPGINVTIIGHASSSGNASINQKISEERAENIANILISNGIESSRVTHIGRGESEPIEDNSIQYGASENRRVQLVFRVGN